MSPDHDHFPQLPSATRRRNLLFPLILRIGRAAHYRATVQPRHADPHPASEGRWRGGGDRSEALRLKGPPVETIKLEAEIDATDQLEAGVSPATRVGIHPQLATLEFIVYPTSAQLQANNAMQQSGTLEIAPMQAPLLLFIWSKNRILPVRLTDFSVTEEAFDVPLNTYSCQSEPGPARAERG